MHIQWLGRHSTIHFTQRGRVVVVNSSPMHVQWLGQHCSVRFTQSDGNNNNSTHGTLTLKHTRYKYN